MATLYALITIGVPVYQLHCACTGQSETLVLLSSKVFVDDIHASTDLCCANDGQNCCENHEQSCGATCDHHHNCDKGEVKYIVFQMNTEPIVSANSIQLSPKAVELFFAAIPHVTLNASLDATANNLFNVGFSEHPPLLFASTPDLLNFICQRKVMLG